MSCRRESRSSTRGGDERGGGEGSTKRGSRDNSNDVDRVCAEGNSRRSLLRRRRGMETGIRLVCEGRHSRGSPVPFGVCALPWSREKRFARFQRETRGGCGGEAEDVEDPFRRRPQREHRGRERRRTPTADQPARLDGRRDALRHLYRRRPSSPSLLSVSHFTPPKWEKETILQFFTSSIDAGSRATSPSFTFDIAKYESGDVLFRLKWLSMKERIFLLYFFKIAQMFLWRQYMIIFYINNIII